MFTNPHEKLSRRSSGSRRRVPRLAVEALEDRCVPAGFTDDFEGATLNPFWHAERVENAYLTFPSTRYAHSGSQSVQFNSTSGGDKFLYLSHDFPTPQYGRASVWMYDTAAGNSNSNYIGFGVGNRALGNVGSVLGVDWNGSYYQYGGITAGGFSVQRTPGWHQFSVESLPTGVTVRVDGTVVLTEAGNRPFDVIILELNAPSWRPVLETAFDDFEFVPYGQPDIAPTSLTWNTTQGGVDFGYEVTGADLTQNTTAALYWASGPTFADAIGSPVYDTPIEHPQGTYGPFYVPNSVLGTPPVGATHLLLVADPTSPAQPQGAIDESDEGNNVLALEQVHTITRIDSFANPSFVGESVLFTAHVNPATYAGGVPTGAVQFFIDQVLEAQVQLNSLGNATFSQVFDSAGAHDVEAFYIGDVAAFRHSSGQLTQNVVEITTPTLEDAIISSLSNNVFSQTITAVAGAIDELATAINGLLAPPVPFTLVLNLLGGTSGGITLRPPANLTLVVNGVKGSTILMGHSPALTVSSGDVVVDGVTFTNTTDAPTIVVDGGNLVLRNDTVYETTGGTQAAISIVGGTVDLGTAADPGGNEFVVNGPGDFIRNTGLNAVSALGNAFAVNGTPLADPYAIEDRVFHALDARGGGLVTYVAGNVYVTQSSGNVQRGINAIAAGGVVNVQTGPYLPVTIDGKFVTVRYQNGQSLALQPDPLDPGKTVLVVGGTPGPDLISVIGFGPLGMAVLLNGNLSGPYFPTSRVEVYGQAGNDTILLTGWIITPARVYGGEGDDLIIGGGEADTFLGEGGNDTLFGGDGDDYFDGGAENDYLDGGNGNDTLQGGTGFLDVLIGGNGNDVLMDPDGVARASGGNGNDDITIFFAPDWNYNGSLTLPTGAISGGNGDDTIRVTSNNSAVRFDVSGDNGKDRIELYGVWNKVRVSGGIGTDTLKNRGTGLLELGGIELQE